VTGHNMKTSQKDEPCNCASSRFFKHRKSKCALATASSYNPASNIRNIVNSSDFQLFSANSRNPAPSSPSSPSKSYNISSEEFCVPSSQQKGYSPDSFGAEEIPQADVAVPSSDEMVPKAVETSIIHTASVPESGSDQPLVEAVTIIVNEGCLEEQQYQKGGVGCYDNENADNNSAVDTENDAVIASMLVPVADEILDSPFNEDVSLTAPASCMPCPTTPTPYETLKEGEPSGTSAVSPLATYTAGTNKTYKTDKEQLEVKKQEQKVKKESKQCTCLASLTKPHRASQCAFRRTGRAVRDTANGVATTVTNTATSAAAPIKLRRRKKKPMCSSLKAPPSAKALTHVLLRVPDKQAVPVLGKLALETFLLLLTLAVGLMGGLSVCNFMIYSVARVFRVV